MSWFDEYLKMKEKYVGKVDFEKNISEKCKSGAIKNRFTILTLGIWCKNNARGWVEGWLKNASRDRLTRRNQSDAVFIFVYEVVKKCPMDETREDIFANCVAEYFSWAIGNGFFAENEERTRKNTRNMIFSEIVTFEELYNRVEHVSDVSEFGTMKTKTTDRDAMIELERILKEKKSLSDFLNYLKDDETIKGYNRKSSFYMQKMLYDVIKHGVDVLCNHKLCLDDSTKNEYDKTRAYALSQGGDAINRYLKYNGFYIKNRAKFGKWVAKHRHELTPMMCLDELKNYDISYSGIFSALYQFLIGEKYGRVDKIIIGEEKEYDEDLSLSVDMHYSFFDERVCVKRDITRDLSRWISGNKCVSRALLAIFGIFAGYNKQKLNNCLRKSDYDELDEADGFDCAVLEIIKNDIKKNIEISANIKEFIEKKHDNTSSEAEESDFSEDSSCDGNFIGDKERKEYNASIRRIGEILEDNIENADDYSLASVFKGESVKKTIEELDIRDF